VQVSFAFFLPLVAGSASVALTLIPLPLAFLGIFLALFALHFTPCSRVCAPASLHSWAAIGVITAICLALTVPRDDRHRASSPIRRLQLGSYALASASLYVAAIFHLFLTPSSIALLLPRPSGSSTTRNTCPIWLLMGGLRKTIPIRFFDFPPCHPDACPHPPLAGVGARTDSRRDLDPARYRF